jgi:hypothetical protein
LDHNGSSNELKKATNAQIAAYKDEADYISGQKTAPDPFYLKIGTKINAFLHKPCNVEPDIILNEKILLMVTG